MKRLIGICHNSPHTVEGLLKRLANEVDFTWGFMYQGTTDFDFTVDVVICVGHNLVQKNAEQLKNKTVILIDSPVFCCNYENIMLIDAKRQKSFHFIFLPLTLEALKGALRNKNKVKYKPIDVIPTLLQDSPSSVLHPVQTYLYKIADVDARSRYQYAIFKAIQAGQDLNTLEFLGKKTKPVSELLAWYASDVGKTACLMLNKALNAKTRDYDKLQKEFNVAKFDIRYAMNVIRRSTVEESDDDTVQLYEARRDNKKAV